jgi:hypothetical protein
MDSVGQRLTLGDLVLEDDAIAPGAHVVSAALVRASDGVPVSVGDRGAPAADRVHFVVGDGPAPAAVHEATLLLIEPHGTYNGDAAADRMVLSFVPFGEGATSLCVRATIAGPSVKSSYALGHARAIRLDQLASGDYEIVAELSGGAGARRSIVVNRDAPMGAVP